MLRSIPTLRIRARRMGTRVSERLSGHAFEVAVAAGGKEKSQEDGEVVAGVDEDGAGDRVCADADQGEDEGDAEEDEEGCPGVG